MYQEKFSYSKLETYESCPFRYKLTYVDKHYIFDANIATDVGTLIHYIEETIANTLKENKPIDYPKLLDLFYNIDLIEFDSFGSEKSHIIGVNKIKEKYQEDFYAEDKSKRTYEEKLTFYATTGIYRLEKYLKKNPDLEIYAAELPFNVTYQNYILHGFIDRIFHNKRDDTYIIEDIKTYAIPLTPDKLTTPLQFFIYHQAFAAMHKLENKQISCAYDLPFCDKKQKAGTAGFEMRGIRHLNQIFSDIEAGKFAPNPTPLCMWCLFSKTNPHQPEEAKNLCPYFSHWTKEKSTSEVEYVWMGEKNHEAILKAFIDSQVPKEEKHIIISPIAPTKEQSPENLVVRNFLFKSRE